MNRRLVDIVADGATLEVRTDLATYTVRMDDGAVCDPNPLPEALWVIPLGEPDFPEAEPTVARVEAKIAAAGGRVWRGVLRHPEWEIPVLAVSGLSEARIRWFADGLTPILLRWAADGLTVTGLDEDDGTRTGPCRVTGNAGINERPAVRPTVGTSEVVDPVRLAAIVERRSRVSPGPWGAYRSRPGVAFELVGKIPHPPAVQPKAAYIASGPWRRWRSTPGNVEFQAHAVADVGWLVESVDSARLALIDADEERLAAVRGRVRAVGDPGWLSPSPTAAYQAEPQSPYAKAGEFTWPQWDRERQQPVPEAALTRPEAAQARFLEHAAADVDWLLELIGRLDAPGPAGRRIVTEPPPVQGADVVVAFPPDRSLGDLDIGLPDRGAAEPAGPARGYVTIPVGRVLRLRAGARFRQDDLDRLTGLPRGTVDTLLLGDHHIDDAGLARIGRIDGLRGLELSRTAVTDTGLAHLAHLDDLRMVDLSHTAVTDAGLAHLAGLTRLQSLTLTGTRISDAGLAHLSGLAGLRVLVLAATSITGAGLRHLAGLTQLEQLVLFSCTRLGDKGLRHLLSLTRLEVLDLQATGVTERGLEPLWALPRLRRLEATPGWV